MRALDMQSHNAIIYSAMQDAIRQILPEAQAAIVLPLVQEIHLMLSPS
jgi:hypothetical protein